MSLFSVVIAAVALAQAPSIKVATYNIQALHDGAEGVIETLRQLDADVVVLQEVDRKTKRSGGVDQPELLGKALGMHAAFMPSMAFDDGEYGLAVLSKKPLSSVKKHPLYRFKQEEPRILMSVTTEIRGKSLTILNTHMAADWRAENPASIRLHQARDIRDVVRKAGGAVILAGDFNCEPGSEPMRILESALKRVSGDVKTHPATAPDKRLDHIFVTGGRLSVASGGRAVASTASDHLPVVVELSWP